MPEETIVEELVEEETEEVNQEEKIQSIYTVQPEELITLEKNELSPEYNIAVKVFVLTGMVVFLSICAFTIHRSCRPETKKSDQTPA